MDSRLMSLEFNRPLESSYSFRHLAGELEGAAFAEVALGPVGSKADGCLRIRQGLAGLPDRGVCGRERVNAISISGESGS